MITFLASFLIWIMFFGLFVLWIIDGRVKKEQALHTFLASVFAWVLSGMIKFFFPTVRPFVAWGMDPLTITVPMDGSFPSIHTAVAFTIAVTLYLHDKALGSVYMVLAILVGGARILGNVHYPVDIFGGIVVGTLVALAVEKLHVASFIKKK